MIVSAVIVFLMLALLIVGWPFSLAGMQLLAANLFTGSNPNLKELFARAKPLWTRMLGLGFVVYGSYFLWTLVPLLVALSLLAGGAVSLGTIFLSLALLIFTTYMVARLFINFLSGSKRERSGTPKRWRPCGKARSYGAEWNVVSRGRNVRSIAGIHRLDLVARNHRTQFCD